MPRASQVFLIGDKVQVSDYGAKTAPVLAEYRDIVATVTGFVPRNRDGSDPVELVTTEPVIYESRKGVHPAFLALVLADGKPEDFPPVEIVDGSHMV